MNTIVTRSDVADALELPYHDRTLDQFAKLWQEEFLPFEEARAFARKLGLKSQKEWHAYRKNRPTNIPSTPGQVYNEWQDWGDWLGTGNAHRKNFLPFKKARAFVRKLGLKSGKEWGSYSRSVRKPANIPACPSAVYDEWRGTGDWLGTGTVATFNMVFLPFKKARAIVRRQGLKNQAEWNAYRRNGRPTNIPSSPAQMYSEWQNWGDWLGTGTIANQNKVYLPFKKARAFVRKLGLKSRGEWKAYRKPANIPSTPDAVYKGKWQDWGDWLGTGVVATKDRVYLPFTKARAFVRKLCLKSFSGWQTYSKTNRPTNIPSNPNMVYDEWQGMGDWLGFALRQHQFLSFKKARAFARRLRLDNWSAWRAYCKGGDRPGNVPSEPARIYDEWQSWGDWLGTGNIATKDRVYLPFKKARAFVRKLGLKNENEWRIYGEPANIPASPNTVYDEWQGWGDWLGTGNIAPQNKVYPPFKKARAFVRKLGLRSREEWEAYKKPTNIRGNPTRYDGWQGWGDWLGY